MSLDLLRDACLRAFAEAAETSTNAAINMLPGMAKSTDDYAMSQVDRLAVARAMMTAARIVEEEYKKLTQPEEKQNVTAMKPRTGSMY